MPARQYDIALIPCTETKSPESSKAVSNEIKGYEAGHAWR